MRLRARIDKVQPAIMDALLKAGVSVQPLHMVGKGVPDLLCGIAGRNYLLELKTPGPPSSMRLTPDESKWHKEWNGQVAIARSIEEALAMVGLQNTM